MAELVSWDGATVTKMIEERRYDEAGARVEEVLRTDPAHLPATMARARLFTALGQHTEALALSESLATTWPANKWVSALRIDTLLAADDLAGARAAFLAMPVPGDDDRNLLMRLMNALGKADPDAESRIALLKSAAEAWPEQQVVLIRIAAQTLLLGRGAEASAYLDRAAALGPLPAHALKLKESLVASTGDHASAVAYLKERAAQNPDDTETARRLIRLLATVGDFAASDERMIAAMEKWPQDWLVLYRLNRTFLSAADDAAIYAALKPEAGASDLWRLQFAHFALRTGHAEAALETLEPLAVGSSSSHIAGPTLAALDRARREGQGAPRVGLDMSRDVEVVKVDGAVATLVVFGSLVGGIGHLPFHVVDPLLARLPVNIVYLRDRYGLAFLRGVAGLGPDEDSTAAALAALVEDLGARRVVTTGSSIAGYAATRYGLAIGADATLSFAGPLAMGDDSANYRPTALGIEELRAVTGGSADLTGDIAAAGDTYALTLVIGSDYAPDITRANAADGLDNVTLVTLPGVEHHFAALAAIADGRYLSMLNDVISPGALRDAN